MIGKHLITCRISSMETWQKLWRCIMANIRRRQHIAGGSTHSFNLFDEELSKFVGVDVSWGLCHVTRLVKITARARGHMTFWFEWSTIVTILHRFRDRPLYSDLKLRNTAPVFEALLGHRRSNFVTAISCLKARIMGLSGGEIISTNLYTF